MRLVEGRSSRSGRVPALSLALAACVLALALRVAPVAAAEPVAAAPPAVSAPAIPSAAAPSALGLPVSRLFDPSRLTWSQSLTFGYSGGSGFGGSSGLYTSSFGYRIADPLRLRVDVGAQLTSGFRGMGQDPSIFLQGLTLDWQPFKNSFIRIQYQDYRSPLQGMGYSPYGFYGPARYGFEPFPDSPSRN